MSLTRQKSDWNDLGQIDPLWAILSDKDHKFGHWKLDEFFHTGEKEINFVLSIAHRFGLPIGHKSALDFGCGVGRLTRALRNSFDSAVGVDISDSMIKQARELNPNCDFILIDGTRLPFADHQFDFVYSNVVLQHQPSKAIALAYISEFIRVCKPNGIIVFQLPSHIPLRRRLRPRQRLYQFLKKFGFSSDFLYRRGLCPITMLAMSKDCVTLSTRKMGGTVINVLQDELNAHQIESRTYFVSPNSRSSA